MATEEQRARCLVATCRFADAESALQGLGDDVNTDEFIAAKAALGGRKQEYVIAVEELTKSTNKVAKFFADAQTVDSLRDSNSLNMVGLSQYNIMQEDIDAYAALAKLYYEAGDYHRAEHMLMECTSVGPTSPEGGPALGMLWGRLACRIMLERWTESVTDVMILKQAIEHKSVPPVEQLQQRSWLIHWALFVQFNGGAKSGATQATDPLENFLGDRYSLQAMENMCPWMLRYFAVSVILFNRRKGAIDGLLRELRGMGYLYSDCFTEFMLAVYDRFDFKEARQHLAQCREVMSSDFFLHAFKDRFAQQARLVICEMTCLLNRSVDMATMAEKLGLTADDAEKWMVDMVMGAAAAGGATAFDSQIDARIDSNSKQVLMNPPSKTGHLTVADATRHLTTRANVLGTQLEKVIGGQASWWKLRQEAPAAGDGQTLQTTTT